VDFRVIFVGVTKSIQNMKYAIRAVKYFIHISILLTIIIAALVALKVVDGGLGNIFRNGYDSIWQLAIMFAVLSGVYPIFGYSKTVASVTGSLEERKQVIIDVMRDKGYVLSKESDGCLKFNMTNLAKRIIRDFEDTVTVKSVFGGFEFEGYRKDVVPLALKLEDRTRETKQAED